MYHSSAGSKSAGNQAGSAFWINRGNNRVFVGRGPTRRQQERRYRITWRAQGVKGKYVKLTPTKPEDCLTG